MPASGVAEANKIWSFTLGSPAAWRGKDGVAVAQREDQTQQKHELSKWEAGQFSFQKLILTLDVWVLSAAAVSK